MMDKVSHKDIQNLLYEKGIKWFKRLRSIVVWKFGFYFWKEIPAEVARDACVIKHVAHVKSEDDLRSMV